MPLQLKALKEISFFSSLPEKEIQELQSSFAEKTFKKGEHLHASGSCCERLFFVRSGRIKLYRLAPSGKEQILEILGPGDTCACNPGEKVWYCGSTAEALEISTVWFLPREKFVQAVERSARLMHALNELFAAKLQNLTGVLEELSLMDSRKRLVKFLLDRLARKTGIAKSNVLFLRSTREEIAQQIGTARETVARQLSLLKREHLIDLKPYQVIVLDREALQKILEGEAPEKESLMKRIS